MHPQELGQALAAATHDLALLQDLSARLGPPRLVLHGGGGQAISVPPISVLR
jgi:hypothetical protein